MSYTTSLISRQSFLYGEGFFYVIQYHLYNDATSLLLLRQIQFTDLTRNQQMVRTLVYPHSLGNTEDAISIMAPIGASLLGVKVGDTIDWPLPNQQATRLRVDAILWQPEREKQYHR